MFSNDHKQKNVRILSSNLSSEQKNVSLSDLASSREEIGEKMVYDTNSNRRRQFPYRKYMWDLFSKS